MFAYFYASTEWPLPRIRYEPYVGLGILDRLEANGLVAFQIFSLYAGVQLWRVKVGAVRIAKIYLISYFAFALVCAAGPFAVEVPPNRKDVRAHFFFLNSIPATLYFLICFSYLSKSQRVRATFLSSEWSGDSRQNKE